MKKKIVKYTILSILTILVIFTLYSVYNWTVSGKQYIKISTSSKAYANSNLYVSVIAQENGVDLETKTKLNLLDNNGKKVKNVDITYENNNAILKIPEISAGNYYIQAKVSSEAGKDTVKQQIYIANSNEENITISLDKGIYKPGDVVNFRALLTNKENDEPTIKDTNISIYDGNDNKVYNENVKTSEYGIVNGNFTLASEVNSGIYKLVVQTETNETTKEFKVNPYTTPKYEANISLDKDKYLIGDVAKININAKYFFGEPVSNGKYELYINNEKYKSATLDESGNATIEYEIKEAKEYSVKVEIVDTSNYYVEGSSNFIAGTDKFEIELLAENNILVAGRKNDIYVFTKNIDGTPVKTNVLVLSDKYVKQVVTDENGIGKFSIDIDNNTNNNYKSFEMSAIDENGNNVKKAKSIKIETKKFLVSTDKVKYNQGEDIKVNISSMDENSKNVYFFKNDKLVKMITTDADETTVNLEDIYGLIDIYATEKTKSNTYKKTIFISPTKKLNIGITTDKSGYKPGENISISFSTQNEENSAVDSALLVSMLDNSVLNLADNDLSIDNIKLALSEIKFSKDLDAATLYSCIVNDTSEQTLMALLLKQGNSDTNVSETGKYNHQGKENFCRNSIIGISIIVLILIGFLFKKFSNKAKKILKHIINFVVIDATFTLLCANIIGEFFWEYIDDSWITWVVITVLGLVGYITWISKFSEKIFKTTIAIVIAFIIGILVAIIHSIWELPIIAYIGIFALILLALTIFAKFVESKKLEDKKIVKAILIAKKYIFEYTKFAIISIIIGIIIQFIFDLPGVTIAVIVASLYYLSYLFINTKTDIEKEKILEKVPNKVKNIAIAIIVLIIFTVVIIIIKLGSDALDRKYLINEPQFNGGSYNGGLVPEESISTDNSKGDTTFEGFDNIFSIGNNTSQKNEEEIVNENTQEKEIVKDENIRNVFLESMCFIPELITNEGKANLNLELSDNITTWTIQTVGNTKDGRIGYGILENVKVFKEFFVDFELPNNLVQSDKISIPVTVYNYTNEVLKTTIKIKEEDWFSLEKNNIDVTVNANSQKMVYVPITILKFGENKFRAEIASNSLTDIVEKQVEVMPKGSKVEKLVSTGTAEGEITEDVVLLEDIIEGAGKVKVKMYSNVKAQSVEGMENIFKMPTGCFEQISSSLYPNVLALKYLEDNGIVDEGLKNRALKYISSGYQKLLTYEVAGEKGGYSLYGKSPAETVLTAYGLMELIDLSEVYGIDSKVTEEMTEYLYKNQNTNGTFKITGQNKIGISQNKEELAYNAYIIWALSESNPKDERLQKSVEYLKNKLDDIDDNYTLALVANIFANTEEKDLNTVLKRLVSNININENTAYITSNTIDYYGSRGNVQTIQTVALTSMALSKANYSQDTNKMLINYLINKKDTRGTWYSTQATILSLKALNEFNEKNELNNQTITVKLNSEEQKIEIKDNPIEIYEINFENLNKENKLSINIPNGSVYYEVIEEYYVPYDKIDTSKFNIDISLEANKELKVNDVMNAKIKLTNKSKNNISNGIVTISIPQGFTVQEESLMMLENKGLIEKYEMNYTSINLYLRSFMDNQIINLDIGFKANYPVEITGLNIKAYDYYNPTIEGQTMPTEIKVSQ